METVEFCIQISNAWVVAPRADRADHAADHRASASLRDLDFTRYRSCLSSAQRFGLHADLSGHSA
jgi:hypothetical protein